MEKVPEQRVLHLGCGNKKEPGSFGVDLGAFPCVDLVHNLDDFPYPLPSGHFEKVIAIDVLEHLDNFVGAMEEIHRVCRPGAEVVITGPYATSLDRHHDPTHRRGLTRLTFDYFVVGTEHFNRYGYSKARFDKVTWGFRKNGVQHPFKWFMTKLANKLPCFYETYLPYLYPMDYMFYILKARKD